MKSRLHVAASCDVTSGGTTRHACVKSERLIPHSFPRATEEIYVMYLCHPNVRVPKISLRRLRHLLTVHVEIQKVFFKAQITHH